MLIRSSLATALGLFASAAVLAQNCPCNGGVGQRQNDTQIAAALTNNTVCASLGNEVWQEFHAAGGALSDWKGGSNPGARESVGTWSVVGTGADRRVRYAYTGGSAYEYAVCKEGAATYHFCGAALGGRDVLRARVTSGNGCGLQTRR